MKYLAPIVEGHGEIEALPALLHRIAHTSAYYGPLIINPPIRVKAGSFLNDADYFKKQIYLAAAKASQRNGAVLILLDCDDDCPATLGPRLKRDALQVRSDIPMLTALAVREFESWFLAGARSLGGLYGLPADLDGPDQVEQFRDAKGWLGRQMQQGYDPIVHQLEFARKFDLDQARRCHSFNRFFERISTYLHA